MHGDIRRIPSEACWVGYKELVDAQVKMRYHEGMKKMFQYRLFPTKKQQNLLEATLEECRWLYNQLLASHQVILAHFRGSSPK